MLLRDQFPEIPELGSTTADIEDTSVGFNKFFSQAAGSSVGLRPILSPILCTLLAGCSNVVLDMVLALPAYQPTICYSICYVLLPVLLYLLPAYYCHAREGLTMLAASFCKG